ncbi:MAG: NAD(P)-dependent glycerol-3-phosphate dehydrogenase [Lachnospiraceae bacterium]|nr:NAD(P)-dependent glycerol-3-phosphate dehydrogenase [Lachnospiraceae bacterium]
MANVLILGAGTWGAVVANLLVTNGHSVTCWARNKNLIDRLNKEHTHEKLAGVRFSEKILFTNDFDSSFDNKDVIIYAVSSNGFREVVNKSMSHIKPNHYLISLTKGMEDGTLYTMSEVIEDELAKAKIKNDRVVVLSGPTHAEEVGKGMSSMIVSASKNDDAAKYVQDLFMNEAFRVYTNNDIKGVEVCAAFKNIIALASGIIAGVGDGDNLKAATITRGLAEMIRVGDVLGCNKDTFYGLAGVGDMIVTAMSTNSRNYNCGKLIGSGMSTKDAIEKIGMAVEGINFLPKAIQIRDKYNLSLPITSGVYEIVFNNKSAKDIVSFLMTRNKKAE